MQPNFQPAHSPIESKQPKQLINLTVFKISCYDASAKNINPLLTTWLVSIPTSCSKESRNLERGELEQPKQLINPTFFKISRYNASAKNIKPLLTTRLVSITSCPKEKVEIWKEGQ